MSWDAARELNVEELDEDVFVRPIIVQRETGATRNLAPFTIELPLILPKRLRRPLSLILSFSCRCPFMCSTMLCWEWLHEHACTLHFGHLYIS